MFISFLILLLVLISSHAQAQYGQGFSKSFFAYGAAGPAGRGYGGQIAANIQISEKGMFSIGATGATDIVIFIVPENSVTVSSTYISFGTIEKRSWGFIRWSAGVSFSHVERAGKYVSFLGFDDHRSRKDGAGIHLEIQAMAARGIAGIGVTPFVDINSEFTYGGLMIGFALGKVHFGNRQLNK